MDTVLLPLFPLQVVLFPQMQLPLHIFEPRYKLLIRRCLEQEEEFGVVLGRKQGMARVGCTAQLLKVVQKYDDGRMDILTVGRRRFRVLELVEGLPYLQGSVDFLPDADEPGETPVSTARLRALFEEALRLLEGRQAERHQEATEVLLSFQVASALPLDLAYKQQLLELSGETERQQSLLEHLEPWLRQLKRAQKAKAVAAGNGRGH